MPNAAYIIIIAILIVLSALFSSSETALTVLKPHRVKMLLDAGDKNAKVLEKVLDKKDKMLSTILICNNIVNLSASSLVTVFCTKNFGSIAVGFGTGALTLFVLIFGEVFPKTLATLKSERLSLFFAKPIFALMIVLTPIVFIINSISRALLRLVNIKEIKEDPITEDEIRTIVSESSQEGLIEEDEKEIINNIFDFTDTAVKDIMTPRVKIVGVLESMSYEEIVEIYREKYYTRLPVFSSNKESLVGLINIKDFVFADDDFRKDFSVSKIMRKITFIYEQKKTKELLRQMQAENVSLKGVLDEYGELSGIVTMEDLLEELVGDIKDEFDNTEEELINEESDGSFTVLAFAGLEDVNSKLKSNFESEESSSIGGLLIEKLGKIPEEGECAQVSGYILKAKAVEGNTLKAISIYDAKRG